MELVLISLVAGVLTVLAPCILPLLPIIVGGSVSEERRPLKPFVITGSLALSIFVFTLVLRASTALLGVPAVVWQIISGMLVILLGCTFLWPGLWERHAAKLNTASSSLLGKAGQQHGTLRDIATGAALGPVFSSCSPTYAFILAAILPRSWAEGVINLAAYTIGLSAILLVIALSGQGIIARLGWASNPRGWFKRIVGGLFIVVGIAIVWGFDKDLQTLIIDHGWYAPIEHLEQSLRR